MPANMPALNPLAAFFVLCILFVIISAVISSWIWIILRISFRQPVLPPATPRIVPWGPGSVLAAIGVYFVVQTVVVSGYVLAIRPRLMAPGPDPAQFTPFEMMGLSAAYNLTVLVFVPLTLAMTAGARSLDFGLESKAPGNQFALGMLSYPILAPLVFGMSMVSMLVWKPDPHPLAKAMMDNLTPAMVVILAVAGVVLAPLAEELMFRGVLLGWLTRVVLGSKPRVEPRFLDEQSAFSVVEVEAQPELFTGPIEFEENHDPFNVYSAPFASIAPPPQLDDTYPEIADFPRRAFTLSLANVAVSLLFAGMHYKVWPTPIPIFFLSLGLGFLYQRTGGLIAPVALHMTFNGISTLLLFVSVGAAPKAPNPIPPPALAASTLWELPVLPMLKLPR